MTGIPQLPSDDVADFTPTWLRVFQAAVIGVAAGLALNALVSVVTVQGQGVEPKPTAPNACKKQAPPKDAVAPTPGGPTLSSVSSPKLLAPRS
jgi:hypothetical protein